MTVPSPRRIVEFVQYREVVVCSTFIASGVSLLLACERSAEPAPKEIRGPNLDRSAVLSGQTSAPLARPAPVDVPESEERSDAEAPRGSAVIASVVGGPASPRGSTPPKKCAPNAQKAGSTCGDPGLVCTYVDCPGSGETTVHCVRGKIVHETVPCASFSCAGGSECSADQICVERVSGSHKTECVANPCGKKAVTCECAGRLCEGEACTVHGRIVTCGAPCPGCP